MTTTVDHWDARTGGSWRYVSTRDGMEFGFHGCFHEVRPDRIVQTFTWEGDPDGVALETLDFDDLGDGRTRLRAQSLCDSFEGRDAWLRSGMEAGVNQGYAKLDALLAAGGISAGRSATSGEEQRMTLPADPAERHRAVTAGFTARVQGAVRLGRARPGARLAGPGRRRPSGRVVPGLPDERDRAGARPRSRRRRRTRWPPGRCTPTRCSGCSTGRTRPPPSDTRWWGRCRCRKRSTGSTRPTSSCTPGTWPAPPARTSGSTRQTCADLLAGMEPIEELLRSSGQYGPRVPVPDDADVQTRLLGFIGRDPLHRTA